MTPNAMQIATPSGPQNWKEKRRSTDTKHSGDANLRRQIKRRC